MKSGTRENSAGEKRKNRTPNSTSAAMSTADGDVSESLSDIDDAEVASYLNSKKAAQFKRLIWEVMNQDYEKGKSRKRTRKANTAAPAKKAVKVSTVNDNEKGNSPGLEEGRESNSDMHQSNEKKSFGKSLDDEFEHEDEFSGEVEVNQGYEDDDTYIEHDECNAYNYDEEFAYNGFDEF